MKPTNTKHKSVIEKYDGSTEQLVEDIGNLKYDSLSEFLKLLSEKIERDSKADAGRERFKLAKELESASKHIGEAWRISEPFM